MPYTKGFEHRLFFRMLSEAIPQGMKNVAATERREQWLKDYPHYLTGAMLITCFSYIEGYLGPKWIDTYGGEFKRELYTLRIIRHSITHTNGNLKDLEVNRRVNEDKGYPADKYLYIKTFVTDMTSNEYRLYQTPNWDKNDYIYLADNGNVYLGDSAYQRLSKLANDIFKNAGLIVYEKEE